MNVPTPPLAGLDLLDVFEPLTGWLGYALFGLAIVAGLLVAAHRAESTRKQ